MAISPEQAVKLAVSMVERNLPIMLVGMPGCGKTDIMRDVARITERNLFLLHPVIDSPEDYKGFPMFQNGEADFYPLGIMREILNAREPSLVGIDDLGQAPGANQASLMQWIHPRNRELSGRKMPDCVSIMAASNRREDNAGVAGFLDPLKDRWTTIVEVGVSLASWTRWAVTHDIDPRVISYLHLRPNNLSTFEANKGIERTATPRGWESMSNMLSIDVPKGTQLEVYTGIVGKSVASEFFEFLQVEKDLPDPNDICNGIYTKVPDEGSVRYAIIAAIAHRGDNETHLTNIIKYVLQFKGEFQKLWELMYTSRYPEMMKTEAWGQWVSKTAHSQTI